MRKKRIKKNNSLQYSFFLRGGGNYFFNSSRIAGASQPHRHIQLLRRANKVYCPRNEWFINNIINSKEVKNVHSKYGYAVLSRNDIKYKNKENQLYMMYIDLISLCNIGNLNENTKPTKPYNLIITPEWFALIIRTKEKYKGFNINGLGFAGYLLATEYSDIDWIIDNGPHSLLNYVSELV